jgi:hypothetical protein
VIAEVDKSDDSIEDYEAEFGKLCKSKHLHWRGFSWTSSRPGDLRVVSKDACRFDLSEAGLPWWYRLTKPSSCNCSKLQLPQYHVLGA